MNTYSLRPAAAIVIAGAAIALLVAVPSPAAAHDGLVSSSPAAGSTATSEIETVSLTFSDELLDIGDSNGAFAIQVTCPLLDARVHHAINQKRIGGYRWLGPRWHL